MVRVTPLAVWVAIVAGALTWTLASPAGEPASAPPIEPDAPAVTVFAIDSAGRQVDPARSHASLQRTPPRRSDPLRLLGDASSPPPPRSAHSDADPDALRYLFAAPADDLAVEILEHLDDEDPALVDRIFHRRRQRLVDASREQVDDLPIAERVAAVAGDLDAQGYLADFEQTDDGDYRINLHSCPMWTVADRYRQACAAELGYVEDLVPDADVERITHKTAGAHTCTYRITPRS